MSTSFVHLVAAMRQAQKTYFKERTQTTLKEAKRLEQEVDARLAFLIVQAADTQIGLPLA